VWDEAWRSATRLVTLQRMQSDEKADVVVRAGWYSAAIPTFLIASDDEILGVLTRRSGAAGFSADPSQLKAWRDEISVLQRTLEDLQGWLYLEFDIPRLGSRIDAVVILGSTVFPIEFKVGQSNFLRADVDQSWDYGLDLKNFHAGSHSASILPVLVCTEADPASIDNAWSAPHADGVRRPRRTNPAALRTAILSGSALSAGAPLDGDAWGRSPYRPTPTIIQAARALYSRHSVESISRNDAGATNLRVTSKRVEEVIDDARAERAKAIVFVTGVPGAGKTLVGLNIATRRSNAIDATHAVYLSGNGPLVAVLRESLTRDEVVRLKATGAKPRKGAVGQPIKAFIQNVHHFRDEGVRNSIDAPSDHVVIFDESQRAWNLEQTRNFMARRKGLKDFAQSEPEFLLSYVDRHRDWGVVVCLVGGGQEINTGEAGIAAWLDAIRTRFSHWRVYISPSLQGAEYAAKGALKALESTRSVRHDEDLHLSVSMRSFRAESVSAFVKAVLDSESEAAGELLAGFQQKYPIVLTRDLGKAREWIRDRARGTERYGLVASSLAMRLKPHAIDVRVAVDPVHYFLADSSDTRSSYYLEDAATEFHIQGLELDWVVMNWDADLRHAGRGWSHHAFRGAQWQRVNKPERQQYLVNAYRVLMTRARQGMVIFVPPGDAHDHTRRPEFYDGTYTFLRSNGLPELA
jgi:Uncharacterized conserved protein (DUF2075)